MLLNSHLELEENIIESPRKGTIFCVWKITVLNWIILLREQVGFNQNHI